MLQVNRVFSVSSALLLALAAHPLLAAPALRPIPDTALLSGSPLHVPVQGLDPEGRPLVFEAVSSDEALVSATLLEGNRSLRIVVQEFGTMTCVLFEGRVPRATQRIIELAESTYYDGLPFHIVIDGLAIQAGHADGSGSTLGPFDDQYHVDLQHNRGGVLSLAKRGDDSNDAQFFITEGPAREFDFDRTIFGLLVDGEQVREAISNVETSNSQPIKPVTIESIDVFTDDQNAVLMLKSPEGATGTAQITVTTIDRDGVASRQSFRVDVTPDTINSPPFLADIPPLSTSPDTPITYQLQAVDVEGDASLFLDEVTLTNNGLVVPFVSSPDVDYSVGFETGLLTVTPLNGVTGLALLTVATGVVVDNVDYEVVQVRIE
jgi:cyclophilin family peptidyl-prolyl cis-trans isomerase